jgi:hypothetical protein
MRVETVTFEQFADVSLARLARATSIFVVWDASDDSRPRVLSHGTFLSQLPQLTDAESRLSKGMVGYIALCEGQPKQRAKAMAAVVEQLLRDVARELKREPAVAARRSATKRVRDLCAGESLRIDVRGYNPLESPTRAHQLAAPRRIAVRPDANGYSVSHDWH